MPGMRKDRVYDAYHGIDVDAETGTVTRARIDRLVAAVPDGRVLDLGCSQGIAALLLAERGDMVVGLDFDPEPLRFAVARAAERAPKVRGRLAFACGDGRSLPLPSGSFDVVILGEVLEEVDDPERMLAEVFRVLREDGRLALTTPFGLLPGSRQRHVFYRAGLLRLLEPLFEVSVCERHGPHLHTVAVRRAEPLGELRGSVDEDEAALAERERAYVDRIERLQARLDDANAAYRRATQQIASLRATLARNEQDREKLAGELAVVQRSKGWRAIQRLRRLRRRVRHAVRKPAADAPAVAAVPATPVLPPGFVEAFERWVARAAEDGGPEVVFMFSGTTFVQEKRGNRPIRLTREYLDEGTPVFFNYYRWGDEPIPDDEHPLLFQCPIDLTPELIEPLLLARFGGRRRIMFASFPHVLMVRWLARAAQEGWTTIYDVRDDWEEFERVGAAKWYRRTFEEYVVREADIVTTVSRPLARKIAALAERDDVRVVPNALDESFPDPPGPRTPQDPAVVGYFGHLTAGWFDWDLLTRAARAHPTWRFELAGHGQPAHLELPPNVELLGLLSHADLASRSVRWSLAIIPFKFGPLTESVDPIKVYEYLHLGLPVLSTYMPQMQDYPGVEIAEAPTDFLDRLAAGVGRELDQDEVRDWLKRNTWRARVETYRRLVADPPLRVGLRALLGGPS